MRPPNYSPVTLSGSRTLSSVFNAVPRLASINLDPTPIMHADSYAYASPRPSSTTRQTVSAAPTPPHHRHTPITVLVAEESGGLGRSIADWLLGDDIAIVGAAPHCLEVTELAAKLQPDVVIMTFGMAVRNGLEAIRRTLEQLCNARLLVLTPHTDHAFDQHIASAGAAGFIPEDACSQMLPSAVREIHEKHAFFPPDYARRATLNRGYGVGPADREKNGSQLTTREQEVLQLVAEGNGNKQTAAKLGISIKTVEKHRQNLMDKLCIHDTATLTRYALYAGIVR